MAGADANRHSDTCCCDVCMNVLRARFAEAHGTLPAEPSPPTDEQIRAYLDRHPSAFGEFLRREIRRDPEWWDRMRRRQDRIEGRFRL